MSSCNTETSPMAVKEIINTTAGMTEDQRAVALSSVPSRELVMELLTRIDEYEQALLDMKAITDRI